MKNGTLTKVSNKNVKYVGGNEDDSGKFSITFAITNASIKTPDVTFTFEIKSENSNCKDEVFRKASITTPIYNYLSETEFCAKNSTLDVCKQFSDRKYDSTEFDEAKKEVEKNKNDKKGKTKKNNWFADNKYLVIIGGSVIIVIGVATAWVRIKKRRSKQL